MSVLRRWITVGLGFCVAVTAVGCSGGGGRGSSGSGHAPSGRETVATAQGPVTGQRAAGGGTSFLGVPYAASPVGRLRWQPPRPAPSRAGVLAATRAGHACPQPDLANTSEDCLVLNIYVPPGARADASHLPVLVWLYGGGFLTGQGTDVDGARLAEQGRLIVVAPNYRLGALGFLSLSTMTESTAGPGPGDFGLLDQQAALGWVRANIAGFGGDPARVTLSGQSAGGASVCANLVSPSAEGLFQRAVAQSGCAQRLRTRAESDAQGATLAAAVGCARPATQLECLRGTPADQLVAAANTRRSRLSWEPAVGGTTLPTPILAGLARLTRRVPVLVGTNRDEGGVFVVPSYDSTSKPLSEAGYQAALTTQFGAAATTVATAYAAGPGVSPGLALARAIGDSRFSCRGLSAADLLARAVPTYAYEFVDTDAPGRLSATAPFPLGAYHGAEIQYVLPRADSALTGEHAALSKVMIRYWAAFAADGDPNTAGAASWPTYVSGSGRFQSLDPAGVRTTTSFAADHHCDFWKQVA